MLLKNGSKDYKVKIIQNNLKLLSFGPISVDGVFGNETESAVKNFQEYYGLNIDGIVGDITWSTLANEIKKIQTALNNNGYDLAVDGIAGTNTYNALIEFQQSHNLKVDGIAGEYTRSRLFSNETSSDKFNISDSGIDFIADYESFYSKPYRGLDYQNETIGYGHVITERESFESLTEAEAKDLLRKDLNYFVNSVNTMLDGTHLSQNQFDALISFAYNCGTNALKSSTLLKDIKTGADAETLKKDFLMWCNCNGKRALGLYRRRYDEFEIYSNGDYTRTYRDFE